MPRGRKKQNQDSDSNNRSGGQGNRGFASMDPERRREIAREGGRSSHSGGRGSSRRGSREIDSGNYGRSSYSGDDSGSFDQEQDQSSSDRGSGRSRSAQAGRRTQIVNEDAGDAHTISITAFTILNDTTIDDGTRVRMLREYFNG